MGNLVRMPHSEVTATLEALDKEGVRPEELAKIRMDDSLLKKVAELLKSGKPAFERRKPFVRALKILGERRVFTPERVAEALNPLRKRAGLQPLVPPQGVAIPYSDEVLKKHVDGRWLLIYSYGLSLREQRQMVGTDTNQQPCFYKEWDWFLKSAEDHWAGKGVKPGWYLVSLEGRYGSQAWQSQEESIQKEFGSDYERADEHLMGEVCLSAYLINNGERPLKDFYHWGKALGSGGYRVHVGSFAPDGLGVGRCPPGVDDTPLLRVCLLRKFQK